MFKFSFYLANDNGVETRERIKNYAMFMLLFTDCIKRQKDGKQFSCVDRSWIRSFSV